MADDVGSDEPKVVDQRRVKQDDLGSAAKIRTSTLKPKDEDKPKQKGKTEAQEVVARAKARDEGRESDLDQPKKHGKAPPPPWSESNRALADRRTDNPTSRVNAPVTQTKNPIEEMELADFSDGRNWCHCGRALYGQTLIADGVNVGQEIMCRDGHKLNEKSERKTWEEAARMLRVEHNSIEVATLMQTQASDIAAFWEEDDLKLVQDIAHEVVTAMPSPEETEESPRTPVESPLAPPTDADLVEKLMKLEARLASNEAHLAEIAVLQEEMLGCLLEQQKDICQLLAKSGADFETLHAAHRRYFQLEQARAAANRMDWTTAAMALTALAGGLVNGFDTWAKTWKTK